MSLTKTLCIFGLGAALLLCGASLRADAGSPAMPTAPAPKAPADETAPASFRIAFETSRGTFIAEISRAQAPHGADRIFNLVKAKYFDGARFYRVVPGFVVQWGSAADAAVTKAWDVSIPDDPVKGTNARGTITYAALSDPNSRTTQLFINLADNAGLDGMGFAPLGRIVTGMDKVDELYAGDGEKPDQGALYEQGNAYLDKQFPHLDYIITARLAP